MVRGEDGAAAYRITNRAYRADIGMVGYGREVALSSVPQWADMAPETVLAGVERPLFAMLRMPHANTVDPESPLGVSAYARAMGLMREADRQFSRLLWEMESGERALYVDVRAFERGGEDGGPLPIQRLYRMLDVDPQADTLFEAWSPELRVAAQLEALDAVLRRVEDACALSRGTLSGAPEASGARTATELKIMRQRTYAMVRDTQKAVEVALRGLLWAMDVWADIAGLAPGGAWDVGFVFDDSVVTDRSEEFAERARLVEMGVLAPWEMRAWYLGESEAVAKGER